LTLEDKVQVIKDHDAGSSLSCRKLAKKYECSIRSVSNILKRKIEYLSDYETNQNKDTKRKLNKDTGLQIDEATFE
jgi:Mor family transcriptional regulator